MLYNPGYNSCHYGIQIRSLAVMLQAKDWTDFKNIESLHYFAHSTLNHCLIGKCWLNKRYSILLAIMWPLWRPDVAIGSCATSNIIEWTLREYAWLVSEHNSHVLTNHIDPSANTHKSTPNQLQNNMFIALLESDYMLQTKTISNSHYAVMSLLCSVLQGCMRY